MKSRLRAQVLLCSKCGARAPPAQPLQQPVPDMFRERYLRCGEGGWMLVSGLRDRYQLKKKLSRRDFP